MLNAPPINTDYEEQAPVGFDYSPRHAGEYSNAGNYLIVNPPFPVAMPANVLRFILAGNQHIEFNWTENTSSQRHELREEFTSLVARWRRETGKLSVVQKKAVHPAYQRIIGLGQDVLPFIFAELHQRPDDWLWALEAITGKDDVATPGSNFDAAVHAWLQWGKARGYL